LKSGGRPQVWSSPVQLIEVSMTGVRSAAITLQGPDTPLRFLLLPMLHLGTAGFYRDVTRQLTRCRVIVAEGVAGNSILTGAVTLAYRTPGRSKRLGLVVQDLDYRALASAGAQIVRPDLTGEQVRLGWRTVPLVQRFAVLTLVPLFAVAFMLFGSRRVLARYLGTEDLPTVEDHAVREAFPALTKFIVDDRDQLLVNALISILDARADEPILVGVVYGAGHMAAIVRELAIHGYRPRRAEWLTVFEFD
jgi:hypothetical protein